MNMGLWYNKDIQEHLFGGIRLGEREDCIREIILSWLKDVDLHKLQVILAFVKAYLKK